MAVLLVATFAAAENPLRLKSGSLRPLKHSGKTICCEYDFSRTKANRKTLDEFLVNDMESSRAVFDEQVPTMQKWFSDRWDDDIDNGPKYTTREDAPYRMVILVKTLQMGSKSGQGGSSISGYVNFYRQGEEDPFAVVEVLKLEGTQFKVPVPGYIGLYQVFNDLAEYLCDLISHS